MNSKVCILLLLLLLTSCSTKLKVSNAKKVDIETHEVDVKGWNYSSDASWRLAINDSLVWRRKTIVKQYDDNQQLICETITEESTEQRHEAKAEAEEEATAEGEEVIKRDSREQTTQTSEVGFRTKSSFGWLILGVIIGLLLFVCVFIRFKK